MSLIRFHYFQAPYLVQLRLLFLQYIKKCFCKRHFKMKLRLKNDYQLPYRGQLYALYSDFSLIMTRQNGRRTDITMNFLKQVSIPFLPHSVTMNSPILNFTTLYFKKMLLLLLKSNTYPMEIPSLMQPRMRSTEQFIRPILQEQYKNPT